MTDNRAVFTPDAAPEQQVAGIFAGLTSRRVGLFCLLAGWLALGSWPTAKALWGVDGERSVVVTFLTLFCAYFLSYGPGILALIAIGNRTGQGAPQTWLTVALAAITIALTSLLTGIIGSFFFPAPGPGSGDVVQLVVLWFDSAVEFGLIAILILVLMGRDRAEEAVHQEQLARTVVVRELTEARLQLLQSQIEPHFLFNTLANVRWLVQSDRNTAKSMVRRFAEYLEASLPKMRQPQLSLGREIALASAYLSVQQIRMGSRLTVRVQVPEQFHAAAFPSMMLLTLVENAIKHGLAPLPGGGTIVISATDEAGHLTIRVANTGVGLRPSSGSGIGIANIRARLAALHGRNARLTIAANPDGGVTAAIRLPLALTTNDLAHQ